MGTKGMAVEHGDGREGRRARGGSRTAAGDQPPGIRALRAIVAFNLLSTSVHYTHNFVMAECYPAVFPFVNATAYRVGIVVFWPLLTTLGLWGYRLYREGETQRPRLLLAIYSLLGLTTLGHFFGGNPDIPAPFYATLFTDFFAGSALLAFVAWTFRQPDPGADSGGRPETMSLNPR